MEKKRTFTDSSGKTHTLSENLTRATTAEIRTALERMSPEEQLCYQWVTEFDKWRSSSYDGIKGELPDWVPECHADRFFDLQRALFSAVFERRTSFKQLKQCLDGMPRMKLGMLRYMPAYPFVTEVRKLAFFKWAVDLGDVDGIRILGGIHASREMQQSKGRKKGHEATYGTPEEKAKRYLEYRVAFDDIRRRNPHLSAADAKKHVAKKFAVAPKTIGRHVKIK